MVLVLVVLVLVVLVLVVFNFGGVGLGGAELGGWSWCWWQARAGSRATPSSSLNSSVVRALVIMIGGTCLTNHDS